MSDLSDPAKRALPFWPQIEYAAANRMTTADLWSTLRDAAAELGLSGPGVSIQGVNELRSLATGIQAGARRFDRLDPTSTIDAPHIGLAAWHRSSAERDALPIYQVRFQHTTNSDGVQEINWRTSTFYGNLPQTKADLLAALEEDAAQLADKYNTEHLDIGTIQLLET